MVDFPTVGLKIDLTGIDAGKSRTAELKRGFDEVGNAAQSASDKINDSFRQTKASGAAAVRDSQQRNAAESRAANVAAKEQERFRRNLFQARLRFARMEQQQRAIDNAKQASEAAARVQAENRAAQQILAFNMRMRAQEARERQADLNNFRKMIDQRIADGRREAQARIKSDADAFAFSRRMRAQQAREEAASAARREASARSAARYQALAAGGGGGGGLDLSGLGSSAMRGFTGGLGTLRNALTQTRRLFLDVRTAVGVMLGAMIVMPLINMADAMTALQARAGAFAKSASDVPYLMEAIYEAAQRSRAPLSAIATLYTRLAPLADQLGKSQAQLVRISETVAKGAAIGGASAAEIASTSQQLAQALASNRLGGDELRSLAENAPILMAKIAQSLNMNTGEFIKWAHSGKANAAVVVQAIEDAQADIDRIFAAFPVTIGQSLTLVGNAFTNLVGKVNTATGASQSIAAFIAQFAGFLESEKTVQGLTAAIQALGVALKFMGDVMSVVITYLPTITTFLGVVGGALALRAILQIEAVAAALVMLRKTMTALALASALSSTTVAMSAMAGAVNLLKAAALAIITPFNVLVVAVTGLAYAINAAKEASKAAAATFQEYSNATTRSGSAIERAIALTDAYGGNSAELNRILGDVIGTVDDRTSAEGRLNTVAQNRLELERLMAEAALRTAAADATAAAAAARRKAGTAGFFATANEFSAKYVPQLESGRAADRAMAAQGRNDQAALNRSAELFEKLAKATTAAADNLTRQPLRATPATQSGPPTASSKAEKETKTRQLRDMEDERAATIARMVAQARQDELQAQLSIVVGARERAVIEKKIIDFELAEKIADINRQIATIDDDKKNAAAQDQIARLQGLKITQLQVANQKKAAADQQAEWQVSRDQAALIQTKAQDQIDLMQAESELLRSDYARTEAEIKIKQAQYDKERDYLGSITALNGYSEHEVAEAQSRLSVINKIEAAQIKQLQDQLTLSNLMAEAVDAVRGFKDAFRRGDWTGLLNELSRTIELVKKAFADHGAYGGALAVGGVAASMIGGRTGATIGKGIGLASGGLALGAFASSTAGAAALGSLGLGAGAIGAMATFAAPLAAAAAALYVAAKLLNVGGKPTNAGAGYDLTTGALSGNKRTEETESAVKGAAEAIKQAEMTLKASGITLGTTVNGLVIGTRDLTQIYLANGKTITSAIGDAAAATDAGVRAMLEGATYIDETQKKLVESMVAAGRGFDEIAAALQNYQAAQGILTSINNQIMQIKDPQGYALKGVEDEIKGLADAAKGAKEAGLLTESQLQEITAQLAILRGLKIDEVMSGGGTTTAGTGRSADEVKKSLRDLQLQLIAMDDAVLGTTVALQARRDEELESLTEAERVLKKLIWAREDEAEAMEKQRVANERMLDLQERLFGAQGNDAAAKALRRQRELAAATNDAERAILRQIHASEDYSDAVAAQEQKVADARNALAEAHEREAKAYEETISRMKTLITNLGRFNDSLYLGDLSQTPATDYATAKAQFDAVAQKAALGDEVAMNDLQRVSEQYLEVAQNSAETQVEYQRDLAAVKLATQRALAYAQVQVDDAQAQLNALNASVSGLITVNASVLSVRDAIANLNGAILALANIKAAQVGAPAGAVPLPGGGYMTGGGNTGKLIDDMWMWHPPGGTVVHPWAGVNQPLMFAKGGYYPGGLALVGEQGPELINFDQGGMIYTASQTANMLEKATGGGGVGQLWAANDSAPSSNDNDMLGAILMEIRTNRRDEQAEAIAMISNLSVAAKALAEFRDTGIGVHGVGDPESPVPTEEVA